MITLLPLLLQLVLLVLMVIVWLYARKDLLDMATTQQTPTLEKIEEVRSIVEELLDRLDQKVSEVEERTTALSQIVIEAPRKQISTKTPRKTEVKVVESAAMAPTVAEIGDQSISQPDNRYSEVYALADAGLNSDDIARKTGLGLVEVDMVINLRPLPGE